MSEITAEEYRTAAKVLRTEKVTAELGGYRGEADWLDRAAELADEDEALAALDDYPGQLAKRVYAADLANGAQALPGTKVHLVKTLAKMIAYTLAELERDGRLVGESAKATAEFADVIVAAYPRSTLNLEFDGKRMFFDRVTEKGIEFRRIPLAGGGEHVKIAFTRAGMGK